MTNAVQSMTQICEMKMTEKTTVSCVFLWQHQFAFVGALTSDVETVSNALQQSFLQIVNGVLTIVLVMGMVLYLNFQLAIVVILSIPVTYFWRWGRILNVLGLIKEQAAILGRMNGYVQENLTGFNVLKLYSRENPRHKNF